MSQIHLGGGKIPPFSLEGVGGEMGHPGVIHMKPGVPGSGRSDGLTMFANNTH